MSLETFTHNPTEVGAIQVARPFKAVKHAVPTAREVTESGSRKFCYFVVSNVGSLTTQSAMEGDWIVRHPEGRYEVLSDERFQHLYGDQDEHSDSD